MEQLPYKNSIIRLLQGVIYRENEAQWHEVYMYRGALSEYFSKIGVEFILNDSDGYAYITEMMNGSEDNPGPSLFSRRQLGYHITLLCIILTRKIIEFDINNNDSPRLIMSKDEILEAYSVFLPDRSNEAKQIDTLDTHLNKLTEYGFVRKIDDTAWEIRRILKAKFSADIINEIERKLEEYGLSQLSE